MKKALFITTLLTLFTLSVITSYAAETAVVFSQPLSVDAGEKLSIPIYINNNPGIMGLKLLVTYNQQVFKSPVVRRGDVTKSGLFVDSIKPATNGSFSVLWSNTSDVDEDGLLFYIEVSVSPSAPEGRQEIRMEYEREDTFNEQWEEVMLECGDIIITINGRPSETLSTIAATSSTTKPYSTTNSETAHSSINEITTKKNTNYLQGSIVVAVENALKEQGASNLDSLIGEQKNKFVESVKKQITREDEEKPGFDADTFEAIQTNYLEAKALEFSEMVFGALEDEEIVVIIETILNELGIESMEELPESQKKIFLKKVVERLNEKLEDSEALDGLTVEQGLTVIRDVYILAKSNSRNTSEEGSLPKTLMKSIYILCPLLIIGIPTIGLIWRKKTARSMEKKTFNAKKNKESKYIGRQP